MSSNKPILATKIPYADNFTDINEAFNYMVKTINSSFQESSSSSVSTTSKNPISLDGVYVTQSFSAPSGSLFTTFTIPHSLGVVPSSYIVSDFVITSGPTATNSYSLFRLAWTTTDITVRLNLTTSTGSAFTGSFKLLILR